MTFGEKLQTLRARAGLSQDQLAELLDVSRQAVSKWERNEAMPEAEKIVRISRQFGVSTDYLLLEELEEPETPKAPIPAAGPWDRVKRWYRNKGYLLAWALVAWGGVRLLREIVNTVNFFAGLLEFNDPTPEFWEANLMSAFIPDAIPPVLMSAAGVVLALWGRRMAGRLRWYHLGWLSVLVGDEENSARYGGQVTLGHLAEGWAALEGLVGEVPVRLAASCQAGDAPAGSDLAAEVSVGEAPAEGDPVEKTPRGKRYPV